MSQHLPHVYWNHDRPKRWKLTVTTHSLRHLIFGFVFGYGDFTDSLGTGWQFSFYYPQKTGGKFKGFDYRWGVTGTIDDIVAEAKRDNRG